jgi:hypothetical protein
LFTQVTEKGSFFKELVYKISDEGFSREVTVPHPSPKGVKYSFIRDLGCFSQDEIKLKD